MYQLTNLLAVSLNLLLISLVRRVLSPSANLSVLAEVMPTEPLCRTEASDGRDVVTYDFVDGVRF